MSDDINKLKREIENLDLYIWLFSRYHDKTAKALCEEYRIKKEELIRLINNSSSLYMEK